MTAGAFSAVVRARIMARSGGFCEARIPGCWDEAAQLHHRRPRGAGGSRDPLTGGAANGYALCLPCHDHIERNRAEARENGWLVRQGTDPAAVPVFRYRMWVLLDDEGGIAPVEVAS